MKIRIIAMAAAIAAIPAAGQAQEAPNGWTFIVTPYFMAPNMDGKAALGRLETQVSQSPSDIFSNLNWGVMGSVEINNGNWGVNFDVNYMNLDLTPDRLDRLSVTGHQSAYTLTLLKRVHENAWVYAGARWSDMGVKFGCQSQCLPGGGINLPGNITIPAIDTTRNQGWVEPLFGFRAELPFNDKLDLTFTADLGGFGQGSEHSVNVWPQLGFRLGGSSKLMLGYRLIYVDHESVENNRRFLYDVLTFGPTLGLEFRF